MYDQAINILEGTAHSFQQDLNIIAMGGAKSGESDKELMDKVFQEASKITELEHIYEKPVNMGGK